jgi:hypothetical protein
LFRSDPEAALLDQIEMYTFDGADSGANSGQAMAVWLVADAALGEVVAGQGQAFAVCLVAGAARGGGGSRL